MLSADLQQVLKHAYAHAKGKRHEYITVEHLLQALLDEPQTAEVLAACNADVVLLWKELDEIIGHSVQVMSDVDLRETQPSVDFERVMQRAIKRIRAKGRHEVSGLDVLLSIYDEVNSHAAFCLQGQNVTQHDVSNYIRYGTCESGEEADAADSGPSAKPATNALAALEIRVAALERRLEALEKKDGGVDQSQ